MMNNFYNRYYRYYNPYIPTPNFSPQSEPKQKNPDETNNVDKISTKNENSSRYYSFGPLHFKNPFFNDIEEPVFEILGIQLYLDDIIILGLLFFLYKEGVQDELLFITLILLLVS